MQNNSAVDILNRISIATGLNKDSELARELRTSNSTISSWKARNSVPFTKCEEIAQKHNLSLDWLMWGQGEMYRDGSATPMPTLNSKEQALLELFKELSEKDQREICQDAAEKKRMADLERQVKELALKLERLNSVG